MSSLIAVPSSLAPGLHYTVRAQRLPACPARKAGSLCGQSITA